MSRIKIALLSGQGDTLLECYDLIVKALDRAVSIDLLCTGELFLANTLEWYSDDRLWVQLEGVLEDLQALSSEKSTAIVVGYPYKAGELVSIRQTVFFPDALPFHYDKVHLGKNEKKHFVAGNAIEVFNYCGFCFGIQVCIDTHIQDMTLMQKIKGAEIILAPFNTPYEVSKRISNWQKYIPAKAYDYNLCICCSNTSGGIFAVDGYGKVCLESAATSDVQVMTISKSKSFNQKIDYMAYRRPDLYEYE